MTNESECMTAPQLSLDLLNLKSAYCSQKLQPSDLMALVLERIHHCPSPHIWIFQTPESDLMKRAKALETLSTEERNQLPLFGIPFAVKDNIDVAGYPTTAGCPAYQYVPRHSATIVKKLEEAGAIVIGKTNLDQFASGLVGTRSPYGACPNPFDGRYISGGSSSGSAIALTLGLVSFSLGTDTAGSGRVPAAFNNIVGLKPTRGLLSLKGVVPACLSLDCPSIFALTCQDAWEVLQIASGYDPEGSFSRRAVWPQSLGLSEAFHFGVPLKRQLEFFGNAQAQTQFEKAIIALEKLGGTQVEIDYEPFAEAAHLLYGGPWLAERYAAIQGFIEASPEALFPVTRKIIEKGKNPSALETFRSLYRLDSLKRQIEPLWETIDLLVLPTTGTIYTLEQIENDPIVLNTNLGYYTNFMNLLDLCAWAVPSGFQVNGLPTGISLVAPAFHEKVIAEIAARFHQEQSVSMGATKHPLPQKISSFQHAQESSLLLAVFGLHLSGQPLNYQLVDCGAKLAFTGKTAPCYQCFVVDENTPKARPAAVRTSKEKGRSIALEVWEMPHTALGAFIARIGPPLGIGNVLLDNGSTVKGFICEGGNALDGLKEITEFGSWRVYLNQRT